MTASRHFERCPESVATRDFEIDGPGGKLSLRHYTPPKRDGGTILHMHGGGFAIGSLDSHDRIAGLLALHARAEVFALTYRLAPDHPFPAALEDANAALDWLRTNASVLNISPAFIGVAGDSAGANLSARLCQTRPGQICHQILFYPFLDLTRKIEDIDEGLNAVSISGQTVKWIRAQYLDGADPANPDVSPKFETNLSDQPPAFVLTGALDPIKTDGTDYVEVLRAAGNIVDHRHEPHMTHGFLSFSKIFPQAEPAIIAAAKSFRQTVVSE